MLLLSVHFPKKSKHFLGRLPSRGKQLIERMQGQDTLCPSTSPAKERKLAGLGPRNNFKNIIFIIVASFVASKLNGGAVTRYRPEMGLNATSSQKSTRAGGTGEGNRGRSREEERYVVKFCF